MNKPNIKALAIDHGEKIAFGLFALIVLIVLAKTSWARYPKTPDELKLSAENARNKITAPENSWPKAEEESYKIVDFSEKSRLLFAPLAPLVAGRYDFSTPLYHPLYRKDEPKREPIYEAVLYLIAKSGLAPLSMAIEVNGAQPTEEMVVKTEEKPVEMERGEFEERERRTTNGPPGTLGLAKPATGHAAKPPAHAAAGGSGGIFDNMPGGTSSGAVAQGPDVKALGVRYVAVRGVFPLRKQIENYKRALHLPESEAAGLVELIDFVLERQVAKTGPDPWEGAEWKTVSLATAEQILEECSDLDPLDPVPTALKDSAITMNLPLRLKFTWGESATHPKIKDEELKNEEIAMEAKMLEAADAASSDANLADSQMPQKRGLAKNQRDVKQLVNQVRGNSDAMKMMKSVSSTMSSSSGGSSSMSMPGMAHGAPRPMAGGSSSMGPGAMRGGASIDRLVVNSRYLLFRYLDFDVESGMAYRYRVRLQLWNPNFGLSPEELGSGDNEITKGAERETPWSNISNPEVVPATVSYFLAQVDREPYREDKVKTILNKPVAEVMLFDWDMKLGTTIKDRLNIPSIGAFIEDKKETLILDLAAETLEKEKNHKFSTYNVLVDVEGDAEVAPDQHPDLKLTGADKRGLTRLGLVPEALIAMESGEIEAIDPFSEKAEEQYLIRRTEAERKGFEVGAKKDEESKLDKLANSGKDGKSDKKKKKKDPRRVAAGSSSMSSSSSSMMPAMTPSGGGPSSAHGPSKKKR